MRACQFCGNPVDTDDTDNYVEVKSWVNGPKLDGPKLRRQTGSVAHMTCVNMIEAGQDPETQEDLFTPDAPVKLEPEDESPV